MVTHANIVETTAASVVTLMGLLVSLKDAIFRVSRDNLHGNPNKIGRLDPAHLNFRIIAPLTVRVHVCNHTRKSKPKLSVRDRLSSVLQVSICFWSDLFDRLARLRYCMQKLLPHADP